MFGLALRLATTMFFGTAFIDKQTTKIGTCSRQIMPRNVHAGAIIERFGVKGVVQLANSITTNFACRGKLRSTVYRVAKARIILSSRKAFAMAHTKTVQTFMDNRVSVRRNETLLSFASRVGIALLVHPFNVMVANASRLSIRRQSWAKLHQNLS